jgi:hypothetical protein
VPQTITLFEVKIGHGLVEPSETGEEVYEVFAGVNARTRWRNLEVTPSLQCKDGLVASVANPSNERCHYPNRHARLICAKIDTSNSPQGQRVLFEKTHQCLGVSSLFDVKSREPKSGWISSILASLGRSCSKYCRA